MSPVSLFFTLALVAAPDPRLAPQQVIEIVAAALRHNNSPIPNAGVFTAYRFASPANHAVTGPYGRFLRSVKAPLYAPMLDDYPQYFNPVTNDGDHASLTMRIRTAGGTVLEYRWDLSRQRQGPFHGCWMVDGVSPVQSERENRE